MKFKMQNRMGLSELKEGMHGAPFFQNRGQSHCQVDFFQLSLLAGCSFLKQISPPRRSQLVCVCVLFSIIVVSYMWLLGSLNIAGATEYLNYYP